MSRLSCAILLIFAYNCTNLNTPKLQNFENIDTAIPIDRQISIIESRRTFLRKMPTFIAAPRLAYFEVESLNSRKQAIDLADSLFAMVKYAAGASAYGLYTDEDRADLNDRFRILNQLLDTVSAKWQLSSKTERLISKQASLKTPKSASNIAWRLDFLNPDETINTEAIKRAVRSVENDICHEFFAYLNEAANPPPEISANRTTSELQAYEQFMIGNALCSADSAVSEILSTTQHIPVNSLFLTEIPYPALAILKNPNTSRCDAHSPKVSKDLLWHVSVAMARICPSQDSHKYL